MSMQQAEAFMARVQEDPAFAERLAAVKDDPAAAQALVAAEGFDATPEEMREAFLEAFGSELSEEELAAIAGGLSTGEIVATTLVGAGAVSVAAAMAV